MAELRQTAAVRRIFCSRTTDRNPGDRSSLASKRRAFAFLGSSCICPKFAQQPIREESLLTGALEPTNLVCHRQDCWIKLYEALRLQHGFDAIGLVLLISTDRGQLLSSSSHVPAFYAASTKRRKRCRVSDCWGTGTPLREFLHADDLGEACIFALEHWSALSDDSPQDDEGNPLPFLNVGTGIDLSIRELAEQVAAAVGFKGSIHWDHSKPDGTPKKQLDVSRLAAMGWRARIALSEGLEDTVKAFNQGEQQRGINY